MKKLRYAFYLIFTALFCWGVWENYAFLSAKNNLKIDLKVWGGDIDLANGAIITIFVGTTILAMLFFYLSAKYDVYRSKKATKRLQSSLEENASIISDLKREVEALKGGGESLSNMPEGEIEEQEVQDEKTIKSETEIT